MGDFTNTPKNATMAINRKGSMELLVISLLFLALLFAGMGHRK